MVTRLVVPLCVALAFAGGCLSSSRYEPSSQSVRTERIAKPASETVTLQGAEGVVVKPDGTITASTGTVARTKTEAAEDFISEARHTGSAVRTSSAEAASKIRSQSPEMTSETIGKGSISALSELATGGGFSFFYIVGGVCILAGAGIGYFGKNLKLGAMLAALGALFIGVGVTISQWPWIWLIVVLAGIGILVYLAYQNRDYFKTKLTLNKVVGGIEKANPNAQAEVKASIKREANRSKPIVDQVVDKMKGSS